MDKIDKYFKLKELKNNGNDHHINNNKSNIEYDHKPFLTLDDNIGDTIALLINKKNKQDVKTLNLYKHNDDEKKASKKNISIFKDTKDISLNKEYNFQQLPNQDKRSILYITGGEGCGKTTYVYRYLVNYKKINPQKKIFLFSLKDADISIDKINPIRILFNDDLIKNPFKLKELENNVCVFDDIDNINNKNLKKAIYDLIDNIVCVGRDSNIECIITSHIFSNYKETRQILNNATTFTIFPNEGSEYFIRNGLKTYVGLDKKNIDYILNNNNSRWMTIYNKYPKYVLFNNGCYLIR